MKKILTATLVLILVLSSAALIFSACGGEATDYDHTIVFYSSQGDSLQKLTANAIASFEAKYPGWKVNHVTPGGYDQVKEKVISDLQGENQPDVAYCYPDHVAEYIPTGKVIDLNKFINDKNTLTYSYEDENGEKQSVTTGVIGFSEAELADFTKNYYEEGLAKNFTGYEVGGFKADSMLTIPFVRSTELLYYNKTVLDELGLTVPTTWAELWAQCPTIKAAYPACTVLGYDSDANWFITACEQNGWKYTSVDPAEHFGFYGDTASRAKIVSFLEDLNDKWDKGYITTQTDYDGYTSTLFTSGPAAGGIVYCIGSSGGASYQNTTKFTWGVGNIPGVDATHRQAISQGPSFVMLSGGHKVSNGSEKEKMTWLFIKEMLDPTFQASFAAGSGYNPVRPSAYTNAAFADFMEGGTIIAEAIKAGREIATSTFVSPAFIGSSDARSQVGTALYLAMTGQKSATAVLKSAYTNCGGLNP